MMAAVDLIGISHSYDPSMPVIDDVSLAVSPSELVAVVGPSGCGKTTLLRVVCGLTAPSSGNVFVDGVETKGRPGQAALLPQGDSLLPWKRALENALVAVTAGKGDVSAARSRAALLFHEFGLAGFERHWPHELSGGMRQRVAVLRTFLGSSRVLCLDEPLSALDALTRRSMQKWLRAVWSQDRRPTILITHDIEEALLLADRVVVMSKRPGKLTAQFAVPDLGVREIGVETSDVFVSLKRCVLESLAG